MGGASFGARGAEDKPIFLSIGYAACHWCHVMAHEFFEDAGTAAILNANFVCIKVDREERPDLDAIYMQATTSMTGSGGCRCRLSLLRICVRSMLVRSFHRCNDTTCRRSRICSWLWQNPGSTTASRFCRSLTAFVSTCNSPRPQRKRSCPRKALSVRPKPTSSNTRIVSMGAGDARLSSPRPWPWNSFCGALRRIRRHTRRPWQWSMRPCR